MTVNQPVLDYQFIRDLAGGAAVLILLLFPAADAHHGPGTSGSGGAIETGETLDKGKFSVSFSTEFSYYENLSSAQLKRMLARLEDDLEGQSIRPRHTTADDPQIDTFKWGLIETGSLDYGFTDKIQLGFTIGWYQGENSRETALDHDDLDVTENGDISGTTDLWVNGRYSLLRGRKGNLAAMLGIKFPVGDQNEVSDETGEEIHLTDQPSSGAFDGRFGLAYTLPLTPHWTIDSSIAYTVRGKHEGVKLGNRIDGGVGLAYRFGKDPKRPVKWVAFTQLIVRYLEENEDDDVKDPASGGTEIFLSPGFQLQVNDRFGISFAPQIPLVSDLNLEQQETDFRLLLSLSLGF
jgi:hypothetical protein